MRKLLFLFAISLFFQFSLNGQPEVPIEKWTGKTILFIGAHPDDDAMSFGTMAMLQDHGNQIYIIILTSGNVGTLDPKISTTDLSRIRKAKATLLHGMHRQQASWQFCDQLYATASFPFPDHKQLKHPVYISLSA